MTDLGDMMQEGILNKIGHFFLTKEPGRRQMSFNEVSAWLVQQVHECQVDWFERQRLLNLNYHTTADCVRLVSREAFRSSLQLFKDVKSNEAKTHKSVSKEHRAWLDQYPYIQRIAKSVEVEEVTENPALELIKFINKKLTQQAALKVILEHLKLTGNAFWILDYNKTDAVPALIRFVQPDFFYDIVEDAEGTPVKYLYRERGGEKEMEAKRVIHFAKFSSWSTKWGCGDSYISSGFANVQKNLVLYLNSGLKNMGMPPMVVNLDNPQMTDNQFQAFKKEFNDMYGGIANSGKAAFSKGKMEITKVGWTPDEMGVEMTWKLAKESIANSHGVPISMLTNPANRSVVQGHDIQFLRGTVQPELMAISQTLTENLLPKFKGTEGYFFASSNIVPDDQAALLAERKANLEIGVTTRNEERANMGIEPSDNPFADELLIPSTYVPLGQQPQQANPKQIVDEVMRRVKEIQKETK